MAKYHQIKDYIVCLDRVEWVHLINNTKISSIYFAIPGNNLRIEFNCPNEAKDIFRNVKEAIFD